MAYKKHIRKNLKNIEVMDKGYNVGFVGRAPTDADGIERVIQEVYDKNKDKIDSRREIIIDRIKRTHKKDKKRQQEAIEVINESTDYDLFASTVDEYIGEGYGVRDAVKLAVNSEGYTDADYRGKVNLIKSLKSVVKTDDSMGDFNDLRRAYGWKKKFDMDLLKWDAKNRRYIYGTAAYIYMPEDSPKDGSSPSYRIVPIPPIK